jgi:CheY-like chemotaxis protein
VIVLLAVPILPGACVAHILIVDDEESDRVGLAAMLESAGHEVCFAGEGNEALEVYLTRRIHVVLTDMVMPGADGLGLISALKNVDPRASIIAISGKSRSQLEASKIFGADRVLEKPIDREALLRAVADVIDGRA